MIGECQRTRSGPPTYNFPKYLSCVDHLPAFISVSHLSSFICIHSYAIKLCSHTPLIFHLPSIIRYIMAKRTIEKATEAGRVTPANKIEVVVISSSESESESEVGSELESEAEAGARSESEYDSESESETDEAVRRSIHCSIHIYFADMDSRSC